MMCDACGMPMAKAEDHGGCDLENSWCVHCSNPDGTHKTKEEVREGMIQFTLSSEGKKTLEYFGISPPQTREDAETYVDSYMASLPAWSKK